MNAPLLPLVTVMSLAAKPVTGSLKVKVNVTGPVAVPGVSSVMVTVGAERSIVIDNGTDSADALPAASVTIAVSVFTPSAPSGEVVTSR